MLEQKKEKAPCSRNYEWFKTGLLRELNESSRKSPVQGINEPKGPTWTDTEKAPATTDDG